MPQISHKLTAFNNGLRSNRIFSAPPTTSLIETSATNNMFKIQASFYPQQFDIISLITPIQLECPTRSFLSPFFQRKIPAQLPFLRPLPISSALPFGSRPITAYANLSWLSSGTNRPVFLSTNTSDIPSTSVTTMGLGIAIPSRRTTGNSSNNEDIFEMSIDARNIISSLEYLSALCNSANRTPPFFPCHFVNCKRQTDPSTSAFASFL